MPGVEVEDEDERRQKLLAARKKLKNFRASRSSRSSAPSDHSPSTSTSALATATTSAFTPALLPLALSTADNTPVSHARSDSRSKMDKPAHGHGHRRSASRSISVVASGTPAPALPPATVPTHRASSSVSRTARGSVVGLFEGPSQIITTPATPLLDSAFEAGPADDDDGSVRKRLSTFSLGKAAPASPTPSRRSLAGFNINDPTPFTSSVAAPTLSTPGSRPPSLLLTAAIPLFASPSTPRLSLPTSPTPGPSSSPATPQRKRHSHSRSESISLPNLKLGRPSSLIVPSTSPAPASSPSSPLSGAETPSRLSGPINGTRLKFEPSGRGAEADREKEEYRRRALEQLTGGPRREPEHREIALPAFVDDTPTPPTFVAVAQASSLAASPIPLDDDFAFAFPSRVEDTPVFSTDTADIPLPTASTRASLGVVAEEDETEDDTAMPLVGWRAATDDEETTLSGLRELHLVSSAKRDSTDVLRAFSFPRPDRSDRPEPLNYGTIGRGRPRPLSGLTTASTNSAMSLVSAGTSSSGPATAIVTPRSAVSADAPRRRGSRGSSISYRKDGESFGLSAGVSRDWSSGRASPTFDGALAFSPTALSSPRMPWAAPLPRAAGSARPCPRPRSLIGLGLSSARVLGELDEVDEDKSGGESVGVAVGVIDVSGLHDLEHQDWATSRERIDLELEREALRDDVELWKGRCRTLEERLESERKESALLRDRVRKLGDRLLTFSAAHPARAPTPAELRTQAESRLIGEMRAQLLTLSAAYERERQARADAEAQLHSVHDTGAEPAARAPPRLVAPAPIAHFRPSLPSTLHAARIDTQLYAPLPPQPHPLPQQAQPSPDLSAGRLRAWGFPAGPASATRENKRESFFGLSASPLPSSAAPTPYPAIPIGVDLPPIPVPSPGSVAQPAYARAVSGPHETLHVEYSDKSGQRAVSAPHLGRPETPPAAAAARRAAGAAYGFLAHYLGKKGQPDFSNACRRCVGELIEL
ncbi:hypothetical protein Q5752_002604 [Cryptotrichosporon argae]